MVTIEHLDKPSKPVNHFLLTGNTRTDFFWKDYYPETGEFGKDQYTDLNLLRFIVPATQKTKDQLKAPIKVTVGGALVADPETAVGFDCGFAEQRQRQPFYQKRQRAEGRADITLIVNKKQVPVKIRSALGFVQIGHAGGGEAYKWYEDPKQYGFGWRRYHPKTAKYFDLQKGLLSNELFLQSALS